MPRILLAEDDEIMRETLFDRLSMNGWQVDGAVRLVAGKCAADLVGGGLYSAGGGPYAGQVGCGHLATDLGRI